MPEIQSGSMTLHYMEAGSGSQTVVLSHSYLVDHRQFEAQAAALVKAGFRVVAYDHREHGRSGKAQAPYDIEELVADGIAVLDQLCEGPVHWVGLSTGGFVGMRIAARHPKRILRLVLMDTSAATEGGIKRLRYDGLLLVLRLVGFRPVLGQAVTSMFSKGFRRDPSRANELALWTQRIGANDAMGLVRFGHAIFGRPDFVPKLGGISAPTLVITGSEDVATPVDKGEQIAAGVPGARFVSVPGAGHLSTVEQPEQTSRLITEFLTEA